MRLAFLLSLATLLSAADPARHVIVVSLDGFPAATLPASGAKPNVDVAATIARLLGIDFRGIESKPLTEFLAPM